MIPRSWAQYKSDLELRSVPKPDRFYSDPIRAAPINHSINFFPYSVISVDDDGNTTEEYFNNAKLYDPPINAADVATNGSSNSSCSSSSGSSSSRNIDLGESAMVRSHAQLYDALSGELPVKYRARCRIGRGNRLIVDRIPVSTVKFILWTYIKLPGLKGVLLMQYWRMCILVLSLSLFVFQR